MFTVEYGPECSIIQDKNKLMTLIVKSLNCSTDHVPVGVPGPVVRAHVTCPLDADWSDIRQTQFHVRWFPGWIFVGLAAPWTRTRSATDEQRSGSTL